MKKSNRNEIIEQQYNIEKAEDNPTNLLSHCLIYDFDQKSQLFLFFTSQNVL